MWRWRGSVARAADSLLFTGEPNRNGAVRVDAVGSVSPRQALGRERRDRVLAGLYLCRQDSMLRVRQNALHVWKIVVTHTARTLRDILPTLIALLLRCLASPLEVFFFFASLGGPFSRRLLTPVYLIPHVLFLVQDMRQVAARTLGELVKKLGERVLPDIFPLLQQALATGDVATRQGVCVGLGEILRSTSRDHIPLCVCARLRLFLPWPGCRWRDGNS